MKATTTVSRLFLSRLFATRHAWSLPVAAFAVVSTLALSVAGGIHFFFTLNKQSVDEIAGIYMILAILAGILLIMPIASLAGAAAKLLARRRDERDRKSTRLNSSHVASSYAVFCLKKKKTA